MKSIALLLTNHDPNMTPNEHVYAICCRPEVDRFKDFRGLRCGKFWVISKIFQKDHFSYGEDGSGGVNAICSRLEVFDGVISGGDVETFREFV